MRAGAAPLAAAALLECALRWEFSEGDLADRLEVAVGAYQRYSEDPALLWCVQRALRESRHFSELAELLVEEGSRSVDPAERLGLWGEAMFVQLDSGAFPGTAELAQRCLSVDPSYLPALRLLIAAAAAEQRWPELAALQERLSTACQDRENRLRAALTACDVSAFSPRPWG